MIHGDKTRGDKKICDKLSLNLFLLLMLGKEVAC